MLPVLGLLLLGWLACGMQQRTQPTDICIHPGCKCVWSSVQCQCKTPTQELELRKTYIPFSTSKIEIRNCFQVNVSSDCILNVTALRYVYMFNITRLNLQEKAFSWGSSEVMDSYPNPGINITIENVTIQDLPSYAFQGQLDTIYLKNTKIGMIQSFAFSKLASTDKLRFENCDIETVGQQAMKKFFVNMFEILGGTIGVLSSYSVIDVTVRKLVAIENLRIRGIKSQAFRIHSPAQFRLENCIVESVDPDAFRISTNGPVFIRDNVFQQMGTAVFTGIYVDHKFQYHTGKQEFVLENNTLTEFADGALTLNTSCFKPIIDRIVINRKCACLEVGTWTGKLVRYTTSGQPLPNMGKLMWCSSNKRDMVVDEFYRKKCTSSSSTVYIVIGAVSVVLIVAVALCILAYIFWRKRAKRYINVPTNTNCNRHSTCSGGSNHIMVVPEGKTYRETELHVIVERAEPIIEYRPDAIKNETAPKD